jgi:hypothetical protein
LLAAPGHGLSRVKPALPDFVEDPSFVSKRKRRREEEALVSHKTAASTERCDTTCMMHARNTLVQASSLLLKASTSQARRLLDGHGSSETLGTPEGRPPAAAVADWPKTAPTKFGLPSTANHPIASLDPSIAAASVPTSGVARQAPPTPPRLFTHTPLKAPPPPSSPTNQTNHAGSLLSTLHWDSWPPALRSRSLVVPPSTAAQPARAVHCVVYWASKCWRMRDNWALWTATWLAHHRGEPLLVLASLPQRLPTGNAPHISHELLTFSNSASETGTPVLPCVHPTHGRAPEILRWLQAVRPSVVLGDLDMSPGGVQDVLSLAASALTCPLALVDSHNMCPSEQVPSCLQRLAVPNTGMLHAETVVAGSKHPPSVAKHLPSAPELLAMLRQEVGSSVFTASQWFWERAKVLLNRAALVCDELQYTPVPADRRATPQKQAALVNDLVQGLREGGCPEAAGLIAAALKRTANSEELCTAPAGWGADASALVALQEACAKPAGSHAPPSSAALLRQYGGFQSHLSLETAQPQSEVQWHRAELKRELHGGGMAQLLQACTRGTLSPVPVLQQLLRVQAACSTQGKAALAMEARRKLRRCLLYLVLVPQLAGQQASSLLCWAWANKHSAVPDAAVSAWFDWGSWWTTISSKHCEQQHVSDTGLPGEGLMGHPMAWVHMALREAAARKAGEGVLTLARALNTIQAQCGSDVDAITVLVCAWQVLLPSAAAVAALGGTGVVTRHSRLARQQRVGPNPEGQPAASVAATFAEAVVDRVFR